MENEMEEKIDKAVEILLDQVRTNLKPPEALQQSQAVLNMAHAKNILMNVEYNKQQITEGKPSPKKPGAGA